jgi:hypothetical protein
VAPASLRPNLSGEVVIPGADMGAVEVQATAWAYAALTHLGLEPQVLFHEGGVHGEVRRVDTDLYLRCLPRRALVAGVRYDSGG